MPKRVAFFPTCVVDAVAPGVGVAAVRQLRRYDCEVEVPRGVTCCGQPAWNAGQVEAAAAVAATTLAALDAAEVEIIVVPAGSCATMIRVFWPELFHLSGDAEKSRRARELGARVKEFSELIAAQKPLAANAGARAEATVYHHSCHMLRELGIEEQPEEVLRRAGVECRPSASRGRCCGFGGLFSVKLPEASVAMADEILDAAVAAGAREVVSCDSSCLLHLSGRAARREIDLRFRHLAEVLEERA